LKGWKIIYFPVFNKSGQIISLFKILKKKYPHFNGLNKADIYKKYSGKAYKDKNIRDLFSRILGLTEEFLAHTEFMKNSLLIKSYTMSRLAEKNLEKHFVNKTKEAELELSKEKVISEDYFLNQYHIQRKRSYLETLTLLENAQQY
jgi:hypothetical protein